MYQTSRVIIENTLESIEPLIAYVQSVAKQLKLNEKERYRICYAIEETLEQSILFDFEPESVEDIEIEISRIASGLKVVISDHGIPRNPFNTRPETVEDLVSDISPEHIKTGNADQLSAISNFIIHKLLHRYVTINRGKEGRSVEMVIYASQGLFKEEKSPNQSDETKQDYSTFSSIRMSMKEDLTGISRLFYKSYGYTYVNDLVYYPERFMKAIEQGTLISSVALSNRDVVIGHVALMQPSMESKITEWGMAISDPVFRGEGIMSRLIENIMNYAYSRSYRGIFSHSVTNHEFTQKICVKHNFSSVALLVGYASLELSFKNIHNKLLQRESTIIDFKLLKPFKNRALYLPKRHKEMILKLYEGLHVNIIAQTQSNLKREKHSKTKLIDTIISSINIAEIILESVGDDALQMLSYTTKKFCIAKVDILYLFINLEDGDAVALVDEFEKIGYIFGGIFPYRHHEHTLVLQYFNNLKFDYSLITSYTPLATELKEYIRELDTNQLISK
jgi:serine/threonine-protein kinase RsbW